jgi:DNA-binding beta-propeller fold protein YncE
MLAIGYLVLLLVVGDTLAAILGVHASRPRRLATALLTGLLATTWLTYLAAVVFASQANALELADLLTFGVVVAVAGIRLAWLRRRGELRLASWLVARPDRSELHDWLVIGGIVVFSGWMVFSTYGFQAGELQIGTLVWSDFGPTTAIAQSFALGHNLPTEYPHFAGPAILYHFLFYFQVGNLTRLGFDPALANNLLSIASVAAMLTLVMALGRVLFRSAAVGRLAAALFFFHGSLAFLPYLAAFPSPGEALAAINARTAFLPSGFPYRGEEWGIWTQLVFLNQRHLASAIGILLVAVLFVLDRQVARQRTGAGAVEETAAAEREAAPRQVPAATPGDAAAGRAGPRSLITQVRAGLADPNLVGYLVTGLLLGMLPLWNGPLFIASAAVFAVLFAALPVRPQLAVLAVAAGLVSLPQLAALRPAELARTAEFPVIHLGYIVDDPTAVSVATYLGFTFGPKLLLALPTVGFGDRLQRLVLLAFTAVLALAFVVQFSVEVFANHKFINVWLVVLNLYAAAGLVRLWTIAGPDRRQAAARLAGRTVAIGLAAVIIAGGLIDLAPIRNGGKIGLHLAGDPLFDWLTRETQPRDVFLTDLYVTHPILLAGRPVYYGWPYYAWSAGYPTDVREDRYRRILGGTSAGEVIGLLQQEKIAYVAIDDGLRERGVVKALNEPLLAANLERVFDDPNGRHGHLAIYRVPAAPAALGSGGSGPEPTTSVPVPGSMFVGGRGTVAGRFQGPRGIAVLPSGEVVVADSDNHRLQRFSSTGEWLGEIGGLGSGPGRFNQPNGLAVGAEGHLFVADSTNHRVQELEAGGRFVREWRGPAPGFYGPRDLELGPDGVLYVLDQGRGRVVTIGPGGQMAAFASLGSGDSQLLDPTGLAVVGERVYVADAANARLAIFTTDGAWVGAAPIPEWRQQGFQAPDVVGSTDGGRLFASSFATDQVLVLNLDGARLGELRPPPPTRFEAPGAMARAPDGGLYVAQYYGQRVLLVQGPTP